MAEEHEARGRALALDEIGELRVVVDHRDGLTVDVEPVAARLGTDISTIARSGLTARLTGVAEAMRDPYLPFFIARDPGVADPAAGGAAGGIAWVEVSGDAARLEDWLGGASLPVRVVDGAPGVRAMGVGERELRG